MFARYLLAAVAILGFTVPAVAQPFPKFDCTYTKDVIYGHRDSLALTMDVFAPKGKPNGAGVIIVVSGMYKSGRGLLEFVLPRVAPEFLKRGYTVFAVMHGNQPRFTVPEIVEDMHRAVRFIKSEAKAKYNVDPDRIGIAGASSGGHLSLMMGCDCRPGNPEADDPVEKHSSKVAAVACFFPVTDFVEFDREDLPDIHKPFRTLFDIRRLDPMTNKLERITAAERREIGRSCSPVYCAKDRKNSTPTFIIHGDADELVPVHQTKFLFDVMRECGAMCEIDIKPGMKHDPFEALKYLPQLVKWFDKHLADKK